MGPDRFVSVYSISVYNCADGDPDILCLLFLPISSAEAGSVVVILFLLPFLCLFDSLVLLDSSTEYVDAKASDLLGAFRTDSSAVGSRVA